jgi:hypothetical protein
VDALPASLIAVAGTLLGSIVSYVFQRRTSEHAEWLARHERLRQERIAAYSAFAGAITDLRRGVINRWFRKQEDPEGYEALAALKESDRLGAAANHARFRVQLVAQDPELVALADAVFEPIGAAARAADQAELVEHESRCQQKLKEFITAAGVQVQ